MLEDKPSYVSVVKGDVFSEDIRRERLTIKCSNCNREFSYVLNLGKRHLFCPICDK